MAGGSDAPSGRPTQQPHLFDSQSTSDKSDSINQSRSNSKTRDVADLDLPERARSSFTAAPDDEKENDSQPPSPGRPRPGSGRPCAIQTAGGPMIRRDSLRALESLSVANDHHARPSEAEWPREWRAYVCLLGGFLLMFNSWGLVNTYGTYSSYYMQHLLPGHDLYQLNAVGSTQSCVVLGLSAVVGRILDGGYIRTLLVVGTVFVSAGSFGLSGVNGDGAYGDGNYILIWLTQGFISGLGMACFFVSSSQVVATWFKAKKGLAIGIVASGASISGLLYPLMTRNLIDRYGFNLATRYVAAVITATCIMAIIIARPNPAHVVRRPETWLNVSIFWDKHAFRSRSFTWFSAGISLLFLGFYAIFFNLEEWAVSEGLGSRASTGSTGSNSGLPHKEPKPGNMKAFWLLAIMNATSTTGRVGSAYLCDKFGALNVHCAVTLVAAVLVTFLWTFTHTVATALGFVVVFGAFSGAVIGLPPASVAYILGPDPEQQAKLGQWTGMMYSCAAVFAFGGPVVAGHLITAFSTFLTVQLWSGVCLFLSAGCMALAIYDRRKAEKHLAAKADKVSSASSVRTAWDSPRKQEG